MMTLKQQLQAVLSGEFVVLLAFMNSGSVALGATGSPPPLTQTRYQITPIDIPGGVFMTPVKVNNEGLVSGTFFGADNGEHGFLWKDGTITILDKPDAMVTFANGISDRGIVAGGYHDSDGGHAALYHVVNRTWTELPDIAGLPSNGAGEINNKGICMGGASEASGANGVGWLWDGKTYSFFAVPEANGPAGGTQPQGMNDHGQVTGTYLDASGNAHGFLKDGPTITTFDVPGADGTIPCSINNQGDIAGFYIFVDSNGWQSGAYGFILRKGSFVTVPILDSTLSGMSTINDRGQLSGIYLDSFGNWHGFLATPKP